MGDTASADEDHAVGCVVVLDVAGQLGSGDVADVLSGAENGAAQGLVLVGSGVQMVEDNLIQLLLDLLGFPEDNVTLPFDSTGVEFGVLEDIGEDIDALGDIGVESSREIDSVLTLWWC